MKRYSFETAFGLGALALVWVAASVASSHLLVLVMTALIGAVYVFGALELRQFRRETQALDLAVKQIPEGLQNLNDWLITLPAALQMPVRQRIEAERGALPGPTLTPYLVGLLVMLGMLGTFLGMVVTLNGAVFALEGSSNIAGIRAAFSEPIKGLGLAFGTSVAGVATSAMLGLMSSLARKERMAVAGTLDVAIATPLRAFSMAYQRQETFKALQQQSHALPLVVAQLDKLMAQMAQSSQQMNERLLTNQQSFHQEVHSAYTQLAQSVDQSLRSTLSQSMQTASDGIRPLVQATLAQLAEQAQSMNAQLLQNAQQQVTQLTQQLRQTAQEVAQSSVDTLARQENVHTQMTEQVGQSLALYSQKIEGHVQGLLGQLSENQAEQQRTQASQDQARLQTWQSALQDMATSLHSQWQTSGEQTQAQQTQLMSEIGQLMTSSESLVRERIAAEAQWLAGHQQRMADLSEVLRQELSALREQEGQRGEAAVARLSDLQTAVTQHLSSLGTALEAPITRLIETASEAPKAAAEVIGQLRQEISVSVARDNALLEERTRILNTLSTLLDAINHASTEQRGVIDAMVQSSQATLSLASDQFKDQVALETDKLGGIAAQVTVSAVDVASLGETLGFAVRSFSETNDKLMANLQRIEQAIGKSMTRSDEQLAYYVAQAREIIDLSISSQKDVLEALQQRQSEGAV
jgi:hypothetical protein